MSIIKRKLPFCLNYLLLKFIKNQKREIQFWFNYVPSSFLESQVKIIRLDFNPSQLSWKKGFKRRSRNFLPQKFPKNVASAGFKGSDRQCMVVKLSMQYCGQFETYKTFPRCIITEIECIVDVQNHEFVRIRFQNRFLIIKKLRRKIK